LAAAQLLTATAAQQDALVRTQAAHDAVKAIYDDAVTKKAEAE